MKAPKGNHHPESSVWGSEFEEEDSEPHGLHPSGTAAQLLSIMVASAALIISLLPSGRVVSEILPPPEILSLPALRPGASPGNSHQFSHNPVLTLLALGLMPALERSLGSKVSLSRAVSSPKETQAE